MCLVLLCANCSLNNWINNIKRKRERETHISTRQICNKILNRIHAYRDVIPKIHYNIEDYDFKIFFFINSSLTTHPVYKSHKIQIDRFSPTFRLNP